MKIALEFGDNEIIAVEPYTNEVARIEVLRKDPSREVKDANATKWDLLVLQAVLAAVINKMDREVLPPIWAGLDSFPQEAV